MGHISWPVHDGCGGHGCGGCEGGRVKPEGWRETEFAINPDGSPRLRRDGVTPVVKSPGTADLIHAGATLEEALAAHAEDKRGKKKD